MSVDAERQRSDTGEFRDYRQGSAAVALRLAGASYSEIAETLGLASSGSARTIVESELANRSLDGSARDALRAEEAGRLERLLRSVWGKATDPRDSEHLPAVKVAVAIIDRHIRLFGVDAPSELIVHSPTMSEIDAWVATVTATGTAEAHALEPPIIDV
jgi:hypothetical protein